MHATAVVLERPETLSLNTVELSDPGEDDLVVDVLYSGISTGTEKLLWTGRMPDFPGMGYPLIPGYETVGEVIEAGPKAGRRVGERVFVPGARCFGPIRGLFGGAASRLVVPGARVMPVSDRLGADAILLSLAATARRAVGSGALPDLVVGHGVLGGSSRASRSRSAASRWSGRRTPRAPMARPVTASSTRSMIRDATTAASSMRVARRACSTG